MDWEARAETGQEQGNAGGEEVGAVGGEWEEESVPASQLQPQPEPVQTEEEEGDRSRSTNATASYKEVHALRRFSVSALRCFGVAFRRLVPWAQCTQRTSVPWCTHLDARCLGARTSTLGASVHAPRRSVLGASVHAPRRSVLGASVHAPRRSVLGARCLSART
ncbi:UNVERIFIED_CONTAM: hypothetical protein FKN15_054070 [Acipenser sinensis]